LLLCLLLTQWKLIGFAQEALLPNVSRFENFNGRNHLLNVYIQSVTRDKQGYVWSGCNGLVRFDGYQYTQFTNFNNQHHGLQDNYIDEIIVDDSNRVWVGTARDISYYNRQQNRFVQPYLDGPKKIEYAFRLLLHNQKLWFISNLGLTGVDLNTTKVFTTSIRQVFDPTGIFLLNDTTL